MISRSSPPAVGTIQMCGVLVLASRFTSTTLKITHLPSGETSGSPTRFSFIMSSNVHGCLAWAKTENTKEMRERKEKTKRRMRMLLGKRKSVTGVLGSVWLCKGFAFRHGRDPSEN